LHCLQGNTPLEDCFLVMVMICIYYWLVICCCCSRWSSQFNIKNGKILKGAKVLFIGSTKHAVYFIFSPPALPLRDIQPHFWGSNLWDSLRWHINLGIMASDNSVCLCAKVCVCKIYTYLCISMSTQAVRDGKCVSYGFVTGEKGAKVVGLPNMCHIIFCLRGIA